MGVDWGGERKGGQSNACSHFQSGRSEGSPLSGEEASGEAREWIVWSGFVERAGVLGVVE